MSRGALLQRMLRRRRYEKRTEQIFCTRSEKWSKNRSSRFEPKILLISDFSYVKRRFFSLGFCHCGAVLQTQVPKLGTALDLGLLYILIVGTYSKFARKNNFLSLGVCFPQPRSSADRRFAESRSRYDDDDCFYYFQK